MEHELRRTTIAAVLVKEIAEQGVKRGELAASVRMSDDKLRRRLKGDKPFTVDEFVALCHSLGVPVAEMLDRAGIK